MRHKYMALVAIMVWSLALCSCAPDPVYSYPPEYVKPLRFTKDKPEMVTLQNQSNVKTTGFCNAGEQVTAFLPVTYTGDNITVAYYYWTLKDADGNTIEAKTFEQIAPHRQTTPPMWTFSAPAAKGRCYVHFRARYEYSDQAESGAFFGGYPTQANYESASTIHSVLDVR